MLEMRCGMLPDVGKPMKWQSKGGGSLWTADPTIALRNQPQWTPYPIGHVHPRLCSGRLKGH